MYFLSKTLNQAWDRLENLGWDIDKFEKARENLGYPTGDPYAFYINYCLHDQFRDSNAQLFRHMLDYTPVWFDHYRSNHDINNCPYHMNDANSVNLEKNN